MLILVWRESAREDFRQIISYIAERDLPAAERLALAVEGCAERLPEHPFMYRPGRISGTREARASELYSCLPGDGFCD